MSTLRAAARRVYQVIQVSHLKDRYRKEDTGQLQGDKASFEPWFAQLGQHAVALISKDGWASWGAL